ncbi:MAG TPA: R3H domain-containing nucleic acid-binding protein [Chloroflexota bacterium]
MISPQSGDLVVVDDLTVLLEDLPPRISQALRDLNQNPDLLEVVLDLGREPEARLARQEIILSNQPVTDEDLQFVVDRVGMFGEDNRAGIERTLHRISAIRNRAGRVVGLSVRVGRAVFGTVAIIRDIVETGQSTLILGKPGVGKTTMLRETARVLADELKKRVVVVDTSNEIAGDGDIPHPGIGRARRMQVPRPSLQHQVMIEAVENHMPEVIVIDEIGTELEAQAARTIAERGVQLIATAHGNTLENLIMNPTLSDLIGGIQTVTLGDEEARRRGTQKSVLERKAPPTFDVLIELQAWERVAVHENVADVVDAALRGAAISPTLRYRGEDGQIHTERGDPQRFAMVSSSASSLTRAINGGPSHRYGRDYERVVPRDYERPRDFERAPSRDFEEEMLRPSSWTRNVVVEATPPAPARSEREKPVRVYAYGVNRARVEHAIRSQRAPALLVPEVDQADVVITVKNYYRRKPQPLLDAEMRNIPIYVLRSNTGAQIEDGIAKLGRTSRGAKDAWPLDPPSWSRDLDPLAETEEAIHKVLDEGEMSVELKPQKPYIRRLQHEMAERFNVTSRSTGEEPMRRVTLMPRGMR